MAMETLERRAEPANASEQVYALATDLQARCSRIRSLADAIVKNADDAHGEEQLFVRQRLMSNAINLADLIEREVGEITDMGENIEILSARLRGAQ